MSRICEMQPKKNCSTIGETQLGESFVILNQTALGGRREKKK